MKPFKWSGFQVGNRFAIELFTAHATPECSLVVVTDSSAVDEPWSHDDVESGWLEDLRSRWFWDSIEPLHEPPFMCCAACKARLRLPSSPDGDELREGGYDSPADAPLPIIVGHYLWFCSAKCRGDYQATPGRTWRPHPDRAGMRAVVMCSRCDAGFELAHDNERSTQFAEWLAHHVYDVPKELGLGGPGCRLSVKLMAT
jgi:hypothetical protein